MKQLNRRLNQETALVNQLKRNAVRRPRRQRAQRQQPGVTAVNVPMEVAYTMRQNTAQRIHLECAREYIGNFTMDPTTAVGNALIYMMNPATLSGTRLSRIATNYQKYRFRKLALTIQSSTTTSTNGLYIVGYSSNPDADFNTTNAIPFAFDLPGAQSSNIWRTVTSVAKIQDPSKWYNVDQDSAEIMQTTQGYFVVVIQSPPSTTAPLTMPVVLDYEIEFTGSAYNTYTSVAPIVFPAGSFVATADLTKFTFALSADETIAIPALITNLPYIVNPAYPVNVNTGTPGGLDTYATVIQYNGTNFRFWASLDDFAKNTALIIGQTFQVMRTTFNVGSN